MRENFVPILPRSVRRLFLLPPAPLFLLISGNLAQISHSGSRAVTTAQGCPVRPRCAACPASTALALHAPARRPLNSSASRRFPQKGGQPLRETFWKLVLTSSSSFCLCRSSRMICSSSSSSLSLSLSEEYSSVSLRPCCWRLGVGGRERREQKNAPRSPPALLFQ